MLYLLLCRNQYQLPLICHLLGLDPSNASDIFFFNGINRLIPSMLHRSSMHHVPKKRGPSNQCCAILYVCFIYVLMLTKVPAVAIICILL